MAPDIRLFETVEGRILQQEEARPNATSSSVNLETMAIIFTGLLGVIGYVVQSKIARDQLTAARDHDIKMSLDEKRKGEAGILLERVRNQQASCVLVLHFAAPPVASPRDSMCHGPEPPT